MNITRHNYEEFFILYLDNELSSVDRRQVELFAIDNPDLKKELELLLQTRLTPDDAVVFDKKQQLMKIASPDPISDANFEEWFLLYIDDELTGEEKIAVEEFLANHPSAKTEFEYFKKTKLHTGEAVVFPNKETLYRREKRAPVITIRRWKIAVAASLLLAISTAAFLVFKGNEERIISEQRPASISTKDDSADKRSNNTALSEPVISEANDAITEGAELKDKSVAAEQENQVRDKEKNDQRSVPSTKEDEKLIAENKTTTQSTNNLPNPTHTPNLSVDSESNAAIATDNNVKDALTINIEKKNTEGVTPDTDKSFNDGKTAVSNEPIYAVDTDESGKKNKLRGFFRKVTRTFEKRTNIKATDDEDRLLLAGLSIKL